MSTGRPPPSSRSSSLSQVPDHRPANPSHLRQAFTASPPRGRSDEPQRMPPSDGAYDGDDDLPRGGSSPEASPKSKPFSPPHIIDPDGKELVDIDDDDEIPHAGPSLLPSRHHAHHQQAQPSETTSLLRNVLHEQVHPGPCNHGTFSPRAQSPSVSIRSLNFDVDARPRASSALSSGSDEGEGNGSSGGGSGLPVIDTVMASVVDKTGWGKRLARGMRSKKMSTSSQLMEQAGYKDSTSMYLSYYIPCLTWMRQYRLAYLKGDLVASLTVASFYLPMALSLADNLAHVPPINGLYSFVFNPFIYAILGSCPQMIVGPEAAGSLLVGTVVKSSVDTGLGEDDDAIMHARICGVVAGMAGATVLAAGLARLGFLDSVLSRPFLRGFISAVGFVIAVDQLIPETGLGKHAEQTGVSHGSSVEKIQFLIGHIHDVHRLTFAISATSFGVIMVFRELKKRLQPRYPSVAYVPDRFFVVVLSAILCYQLGWEDQGVEVLGPVKAASGHLFTFRWPFQVSHMRHIRDAMGTSFLIALLGFFESSVAAKSLGSSGGVIQGMQLSANRELVALGAANLVGSCFMSLPAFGGYGRSKVNKATGGKTPMSSIFLSLITLASIFFLLPHFYYLPKPVLCSMISVVAWSLIEEAPSDIRFFLRIRGWTELGLMAIIFVATIFYSLTLGIAIGVGLSLLQVIRHSTRPRIQILGRIPGTTRFENAEANPERLEFIEGCLIVKIPEPLTFANTGELKSRLRRLELYGTGQAHPALPRLRREDSNRNVIFDIHGVTSMDGSGTQVLEEIVREYRERGVRVFFTRGPHRDHEVRSLMVRSGILELVGGEGHFVDDVQDALRLTEMEELLLSGDERQ